MNGIDVYWYKKFIDYLTDPLWSPPAFSINNARNLFGMDCLSHLLNFLPWSITGYFLFSPDPFYLFVMPRAAVSELEHYNIFDLGEVKQC